jgi:hypothetical protein
MGITELAVRGCGVVDNASCRMTTCSCCETANWPSNLQRRPPSTKISCLFMSLYRAMTRMAPSRTRGMVANRALCGTLRQSTTRPERGECRLAHQRTVRIP